MPQMAPASWTSLMVFTFLCLSLAMVYIYSNSIEVKSASLSPLKSKHNIIWRW
uniref:ATP synthase complex subunit 8 n=1 Tax=Portunion sp. TaxID=2932407 RepID=A0A977TPR0_9CRUS|nr:ATP synthase F0 subunit 8 [Portunion sp.]